MMSASNNNPHVHFVPWFPSVICSFPNPIPLSPLLRFLTNWLLWGHYLWTLTLFHPVSPVQSLHISDTFQLIQSLDNAAPLTEKSPLESWWLHIKTWLVETFCLPASMHISLIWYQFTGPNSTFQDSVPVLTQKRNTFSKHKDNEFISPQMY